MDYATLFPSFPNDARLWVYAADRSLSHEERDTLRDALGGFFADWTSHGRAVRGAANVISGRLLLIAATLEAGDISGCGIDASVGITEEMGRRLGVAWLSGLHVLYRDAEGCVQHASRTAFADLAEQGAVTAATPVFDLSLTTVGALHDGAFEQPAGESWTADAFNLASAPA